MSARDAPLPAPGEGRRRERREATARFYDEYLSVMDLPAEFFLQTVKTAFQDHALPRGAMRLARPQGRPARDPQHRADDGRGRARRHLRRPARPTRAHGLCAEPARRHAAHLLQKGVGHFGIFNGSRWRKRSCRRCANSSAPTMPAPSAPRRRPSPSWCQPEPRRRAGHVTSTTPARITAVASHTQPLWRSPNSAQPQNSPVSVTT